MSQAILCPIGTTFRIARCSWMTAQTAKMKAPHGGQWPSGHHWLGPEMRGSGRWGRSGSASLLPSSLTWPPTHLSWSLWSKHSRFPPHLQHLIWGPTRSSPGHWSWIWFPHFSCTQPYMMKQRKQLPCYTRNQMEPISKKVSTKFGWLNKERPKLLKKEKTVM